MEVFLSLSNLSISQGWWVGVFLSLWKVALGRACVACLGGAAICQRMRASTDETLPGVFLVL